MEYTISTEAQLKTELERVVQATARSIKRERIVAILAELVS